MGNSTWDPGSYVSRQTTRQSTGQSAFAYTASIASGQASAGTHPKMNPKGVVRECFDSTEHPETVPVIVLFDVTGSMGSIPEVLQKKLGKLMEVITANNYLDHPQILFGAIGDGYRDRSPLQVGQFENGIELDDDLSRIYLEGNGGGNGGESYALGWLFASRQTKCDAWEKRGKKGYLFTIGDEPCHNVTRNEMQNILGLNAEGGITADEAWNEATEKWEAFHIMVGSMDDKSGWKKRCGENALELDDPAAVTELIASTIGILEGRMSIDNVAQDLTKSGFDKKTAASASRAVGVLRGRGNAVATKATNVSGALDIFGGNSGDIGKL